MAGNLELKIIAREVVKPSSPTPAYLSRFNLSLLDQMVEDNVLVPLIWFYSRNGNMSFPQTCGDLKSSLSRTLSLFYPIAGRIRDPCSIDCCDDGVEFVEAQLNCPMSRFFGSPHPDLLKPLVPIEIDPTMLLNRKRESLCLVQATLFDCGGLAICVCLSHKIADAATYMSFIKAWAATASESGPVESPDLGLATLLPPVPDLKPSTIDTSRISSGKLLTRRFFFSASKTEELKARASSSLVNRPTRVEAVIGLIWKCAVAASTSVKGSSTVQHSAVCVSADLRKRLVPLVSKNTVGNLLWPVFAASETSDMNISDQVIAFRKATETLNKRFEGIAGGKAITPSLLFQPQAASGEVASRMDLDCFYLISSMCGLPIYFDFGWGRARLLIPIVLLKNMVFLMDTEDLRGVQALVTLEEQVMKFFEKDQHLLSFASLTPDLPNGKSVPKPKL